VTKFDKFGLPEPTKHPQMPKVTKMNEQELTARWFYNGMREGVREYAHWRDGEQYVGTCGTTLKQALNRIDQEEQAAVKKLVDLCP